MRGLEGDYWMHDLKGLEMKEVNFDVMMPGR